MADTLSVLVVDDSPEIRRRVMDLLSEVTGVAVTAASTLAEATAALTLGVPDVLVLDVQLPDGSGIDVLRRVRRTGSASVVIMLTNHSLPPYYRASMDAGADVFLDKSRDLDRLVAIVAALTRKGKHIVNAHAECDRLRYLLSATPAVTFAFDAEPPHRLTFVSDSIQKLLGYAPDSFYRDPSFWVDRVHPEDAATVRACLEALTEGRQGSVDYRFRHQDGGYRWVHEELNLVLAADGKWEVVGCLIDVTAARLALEALDESREHYEALFENANDIIFTTDLALRFTSLNSAGEALTGYSRDEILGLTINDLLLPRDQARLAELLRTVPTGRSSHQVEVEVLTKDSTRVPLEVHTRLVFRDGQHVGVQAIARDVSERNRLQAQFMQAQKMEAVGRLASGVAHDFNNLLTVIIGWAEMIAESRGEGPAAETAGEILRAGYRAADLTRQLLAFSRRQIVAPKVLNLNNTVSSMSQMIGRLLGEDIDVRCNLAPDVATVKADPGQIEQVLMNLVVNARDAMPRGGALTIVTDGVQLDQRHVATHAGAAPGHYTLLTVSDSGCGMDAATQAKIFEPFFTTKGEGKGTGLGLATVYGAVRQSNGYIFVSSTPGVGTTFSIYLPVCGDPPDDDGREPRPAVPSVASERVLLVEDDRGVREFAAHVLERAGYQVTAAASVTEALATAAGREFDVLVTDVVMPGDDGRTLADELKEAMPQVRVLYMSGYTDESIVNHGVLDSAINFLPKPFSAGGLTTKVREVLDRPAD